MVWLFGKKINYHWTSTIHEIWLRYKLDLFLDKNHLKKNYMYEYAVQIHFMKIPRFNFTFEKKKNVLPLATLWQCHMKCQCMYSDKYFWTIVSGKQCDKMKFKDREEKKYKICSRRSNFYWHVGKFFVRFARASEWTNPCRMDE